MATFQPVIEACLENNCTKLKVTDITGVFNAITNALGWQDASTLLPANVTKAELQITHPDAAATEQVINVLPQLPDPVIGPFAFRNIQSSLEGGKFVDGEYSIIYELTDNNSVVYKFCLNIFVSCNTWCCVQKMAALIPGKQLECDVKEFTEQVMLVKGLFFGMLHAHHTSNKTVRDKLLAKVNRICQINGCGCSCTTSTVASGNCNCS